MYDSTHYAEVNPRTIKTLNNWAQHGIPPGGFCRAVLSNDLAAAVQKADPDNAVSLSAIVRYVVNELPRRCWGSPERLADLEAEWFGGWENKRRKTGTCHHNNPPHDCNDCLIESDEAYDAARER